MDSDEQLIRSCLQNRANPSADDSPWRLLCDRYFSGIHGMAFKMTGDKSSAEDIAQDVFFKVFRSLHQFNQQSKFSTWLYRIAMNTILSHLRSNRRTPTANEDFDFVAGKEPNPEQLATTEELRDRIDHRLKTMKDDFKAAIVLTTFQGLSPGEAAEVAGCSRDTFYWRLNQARNQLKSVLGEWLQS